MECLNLEAIGDVAIQKIKNSGNDEGQVFVTESELTEICMENGVYTGCSTEFMNDINIVVIKDHKKGTYFANKADQASVILAVQAATEATQEAESDEANRVAPDQGMIERSMGPAEPDMEMLFFRMEELREAVAKEYPLIAVGNISANYSKRTMVYKNTNGTLCREVGGSYFIGMAFAGREGDKITSECWCNIETYHLNQPILECGTFRNKLARIEKQLQSRPMKGKFTGTVLMNTDAVVEFVGYLKEIAAGNNQILNGTSMWMDKIGKKVASEKLSIRLDPLDERIVRSETLTFDGFISKGYEWIIDGVLQTYAIDYYTSEKTGYKKAGNLAYNPIIRAGKNTYEDIIKNIENGIIMESFSGGYPAVNGDFSGVAKNAFLIEDGEVVGAVTETMISGNIFEMFENIRDISKEVCEDGSCVIPSIAFDGIVISGE